MRKSTVLIIEDDARLRRLLVRMVESMGHHAHASADVSDLEASCVRLEPSVIVLPATLSDDLLSDPFYRLSAVQCTSSLVLSGPVLGVVENCVRFAQALGLNVVGRLEKPFELDDIRVQLKQALDQLEDGSLCG